MKIPLVLLSSVLTAFVVSGCGPKETATPATSATASTPAAAAPVAARAIEITAGDNMKFNLATIDAKPGEELTVTLINIGTLPKDAMGHNWVLLKKGVDATVFSTTAMTAKDTDYLPAALKDQIIAATELIGPRKSSEVTFTVPTEPGEYTFLCTFPAHFMVGMKGVLIVK